MTDGSRAAASPAVPGPFHAITHLGRPRRVAQVPRSRRIGYSAGLLALWAISIFIAGVLLGLFASILFELEDEVTLVVAAAAWVAGLAIVIGWLRQKAGQVVVVYESGVAVADRGPARAWRWDEIVTVHRRPVVVKPDMPTDVGTAVGVLAVLAVFKLAKRPIVRVETTYRFSDASGGSFTLDRWLPGVEELGREIEANVARHQIPTVQAALRARQSAAFGDIVLTRESMSVAGQAIPWEDVDRVDVAGAELRVWSRGERGASTGVERVNNLTALLAVADDLRGRAG